MKKFILFLSIAPALLFVFACDLQIPKAVQVIGTPGLKFTANWDFDIFKDMMEDAFDDDIANGQEIHECTNNSLTSKTFLIRMKLFDDTIDGIDNVIPDNVNVDEYVMNSRKDLASSGGNPKRISFSGFGDYLEGFKLDIDGIVSKLYVDGSEIVTAISIELNGDVHLIPSPGKAAKRGSANNAHTLPKLPDGGIDVVLPANSFNNDADIEIGYEVYLAQGEKIKAAWLNQNLPFSAELAIWIPLVFVAENNNAEIKIDSFKDIGSFFTSISESGYIESLDLAVGMSANPFKEGALIIRDINNADFVITNPMSASSLNFALSENNVRYINENNFDPEFSIRFGQNAKIIIPRVFNITTISLTANVNHTIDLGGN